MMTEEIALTRDDVVTEATIHLKERALSATAEGITIADARRSARPIIYANEGFERLTGYTPEEVVGRNCRFLQGPDTDAATVATIRESLQAARDCTVEILNYRKDGTTFWNRLSITPIRGGSGDVTHFIGVQSDVTEERRSKDELVRALDELKKDLDLAARIQRSMLPEKEPLLKGMKVAWEFHPSTHLAGDFLNVFRLDDRHVGLYVLDVSGHGASAALLSVTLSRWLSPTPGQSVIFEEGTIAPPARVAAQLNERFQADLRLAQYFTMAYGVLDVQSGDFRYVAAGHPGPIVIPRIGNAAFHTSTSPPIGLLADAEFKENALNVARGDRLYLYTDGVTEATSPEDKELGAERLVRQLENVRQVPIEETLRRVLELVDQWQRSRRRDDDISLLGFEVGE